jgi:uncharacterized membrane protein HdeD (DUF308 family)
VAAPHQEFDDVSVVRPLLLILGIGSLVAGILLLVWPDRTLLVVALVLGIYLVAYGVLHTARAFTTPGLLSMERAVPATLGLLAVAAGVVVLTRPEASVRGVAIAAGVYMIVDGLGGAVSAVREQRARLVDWLLAIASIAAGIIVIVWPDVTVTVVAVVLGISLTIRGGLLLLASFLMRGSQQPTLRASTNGRA